MGKKESNMIKKLKKKLRLVREDKQAMKTRIDQLEELLKSKEGELLPAVAENNMHKVAKDFEVQLDKTWKECYETQIRNLRAELDDIHSLYDKEKRRERSRSRSDDRRRPRD